MGSRLPVLAAQLIVLVGGARVVAADTAPELLEQGIAAYKAGKYDDAIVLIGKSYAIEPRPESLFALAQAERLAGKCDLAIPHYKKLIESSTELATVRAVQNNLALCVKDEPEPPEPKPRPAPATTPPPKAETRVVVREVPGGGDAFATSMFAGGALATGGAIGLYLSSQSSLDAAADASTLDGHDRLEDRGRRDRTLSMIAAGAGVAMIGVAVVRWTIWKPARPTVAIAPAAGGTMFVVSSPW